MLSKITNIYSILLLVILITVNCDVTRQELLDLLKYKQETRNTLDSRIHQRIQPIGSIAGKPIYPHIIDRIESPGEIFFDDDNFAYKSNQYGPQQLIRQMDREEEYNKLVAFLNRYTE